MGVRSWLRSIFFPSSLGSSSSPSRPTTREEKTGRSPGDARARNRDARYPGGERGTRAWRDVRKFVIRRDKACLQCGATANLTVDHVRPLSDGGSDAPANLRTLCRSCHRKRHGA